MRERQKCPDRSHLRIIHVIHVSPFEDTAGHTGAEFGTPGTVANPLPQTHGITREQADP